MNEKDIQKIYAIFFVALLVMFLQTNFTTIIKSFDMDIRNVEDSAQISIHLFYLHNKYYITLLNLDRNICVILIVNMMDEGLKRFSFDCGIALWYGGNRRALILAWLKLTDTCHIHPLPNNNFFNFCVKEVT